MERKPNREGIRQFYDETYYGQATAPSAPTRHHRRLARRLNVSANDRVLDVACGTGAWLMACRERGALVTGIDLSGRAIDLARRALPGADLQCGPAERLPFADQHFDLVTCLGSLEHFEEPEVAVQEMTRVAAEDAAIVILVPNADFLTRTLSLYHGTQQTAAREEVKSLEEWGRMFEQSGLKVVARWRDLHVLSRQWILQGRWPQIPLRALQAAALVTWPLRWQYQVYYLCRKTAAKT